MSVLPRLAVSLGRKDEVPNQELAKEIVTSHDAAGVTELVENISNKNATIASDCIKTLYEIGNLDPSLISPHADEFIRLLFSKHNRIVWGAMMALATIALLAPEKLFLSRERIKTVMHDGSVITVDNGVKTLARVAATSPEYNRELFPFLLDHLKHCRTKEVPQHAESTLVCVNSGNRAAFEAVMKDRLTGMTPSQASRIRKILKQTNCM
jgi:hypothetical protein